MATRKTRKKARATESPKAAAAKRTPAVAEDLPFEAALEQLEGVVDRLEDGDLELEASLEVFEEGVALSKHCASRLEDAERRIEQLVEQGGAWLTRPFDDSEEGEGFESGVGE